MTLYEKLAADPAARETAKTLLHENAAAVEDDITRKTEIIAQNRAELNPGKI